MVEEGLEIYFPEVQAAGFFLVQPGLVFPHSLVEGSGVSLGVVDDDLVEVERGGVGILVHEVRLGEGLGPGHGVWLPVPLTRGRGDDQRRMDAGKDLLLPAGGFEQVLGGVVAADGWLVESGQ